MIGLAAALGFLFGVAFGWCGRGHLLALHLKRREVQLAVQRLRATRARADGATPQERREAAAEQCVLLGRAQEIGRILDQELP